MLTPDELLKQAGYETREAAVDAAVADYDKFQCSILKLRNAGKTTLAMIERHLGLRKVNCYFRNDAEHAEFLEFRREQWHVNMENKIDGL